MDRRRFLISLSALQVLAASPAAAQALGQGRQSTRLRPLDFSPFRSAIDALPQDTSSALDALIAQGTILDLQRLMTPTGFSSELVTTHLLARIEAYDEVFRTFVELNPAALEEARAADAARTADSGPLHGIPVSVKDNIETKAPMHTTAGAAVLLDNVPEDDAQIVAQLRAAGAVILGKANLSEFAGVVTTGPRLGGASAVGGVGVNPYGEDFATAGSSSGSAGAVAARLAMISVGTETSGSLIAPAAYQGCVGMKPSRGLVSGDGVIPLISNNDSAGPIARNVTDAALLLGALVGTGTDYASVLDALSLAGETVGVLTTDLTADKTNEPLLDRLERALSLAGADIRPTRLEDETGTMGRFTALIGAGVRYETMPYVTDRVQSLSTLEDLIAYNAADPDTRAPYGQDILMPLADFSRGITPDEYEEAAQAARAASIAALEAALGESNAAILVSIDNAHSKFYATAGFPAVTVPLGLRETGMPAGVTLIGRIGEDARLLSKAFAFEQASRYAVVVDLAP